MSTFNPKEHQLRFPSTDVELRQELKKWRERAKVVEKKLDDLEQALGEAICSVLGHDREIESSSGCRAWCGRCGKEL